MTQHKFILISHLATASTLISPYLQGFPAPIFGPDLPVEPFSMLTFSHNSWQVTCSIRLAGLASQATHTRMKTQEKRGVFSPRTTCLIHRLAGSRDSEGSPAPVFKVVKNGPPPLHTTKLPSQLDKRIQPGDCWSRPNSGQSSKYSTLLLVSKSTCLEQMENAHFICFLSLRVMPLGEILDNV